MKFRETPLPGVWEIDVEPHVDERGAFTRWWCPQELRKIGANDRLAQASMSSNRRAGTLRGMHFQRAPSEEAKLIRVIRGEIYDVALDLRPNSPTFRKWHSIELNDRNGKAVFIPEGVAHGFQTLTDDAEVLYFISALHDPSAASGVRWNDPAFQIRWPLPVSVISKKDQNYLDFAPPGS